MTKFGQLELKRKNKTEVHFMPEANMNIFSDALRDRAENIDRELEDNKIIFSSEVEKMTEEERIAFYENKHREELLPRDREANASEREKRRLRKTARSQAKNSNVRYVKLRSKVHELAKDYIVNKQIADESFAVERIERFSIPWSYTRAKKKQVAALKKNARACYERYLSVKHLYTDMESNDSQNIDLFNMVANEYENAYKEWNHMKSLADELCVVPVKKISERENDEYREMNKRADCDFMKVDHNFMNGFRDQITKQDIDWDEDFDAELDKLEKERKGLNGNKDNYRDYEVDINTLKVKSFLNKEMDKLINEKKQLNQGKVPTKAEIEKDVNEYLKKVFDKGELRFRCKCGAALGILGEKMKGDDYEELVKKWYTSECQNGYKDLFRFGYCGGDDATEYQGRKKDALSGYGEISIKIKKEKFKDSTSFIVGNSYGNYENQKARAISNPDILAVGNNLKAVYERAIEIKNGARLLSPEQEANIVSKYDNRTYFECHYASNIDASTISEITFIDAIKEDGASKEMIIKDIRENKNLREVYGFVKYINANPEEFGREKNDPLKITVWTGDGMTFNFEDIKYILETEPKTKKCNNDDSLFLEGDVRYGI